MDDRPVASDAQQAEIGHAYKRRREWPWLAAILPFHLLPAQTSGGRFCQAALVGLVILIWIISAALMQGSVAVRYLTYAYIIFGLPIGVMMGVSEFGRAMMANQELKNELFSERGVFEP